MNQSPSSAVSLELVREALVCLYSPTDLARSGLAEALPESAGMADVVQRAQVVRGLLLDAIQALRPTARASASASAARAYECLKLRYVSGLSVEDAAYELSLSSRQVYRDLRWAEGRLTELLQSRRPQPETPAAATADPLTEEIVSIARKPERLSLDDAVQSAVTALAGVAERHGVALRYPPPPAPVLVTATPGILRQLVIQLLSSVVQSAGGSEVRVSLEARGAAVHLSVAFDRPRPARPDLLESALRVADAQGLEHSLVLQEGGSALRLSFPLAERRTVLVVEDKPGAFALYERYLEHTELEPVHAPQPQAAVDMAVARRAVAVVLDIMMPEADGWSVLQALKADPRTEAVPVVICSVVNDPELGLALGAAGYLTKPVSRVDFLDGLRRALGHTPASGG